MLFDSGYKARVKRRVDEFRSEPETLEMMLRTTRQQIAKAAELAIADIQPGLHSLNTVIEALRNSNDSESEGHLAGLEKIRSWFFNESATLEDQIVS
jgi:hypothetical protein